METNIASLQIKGAQKYYAETPVIRGIDIDIEDGKFTVLVGPSGCGKSTLLRMIAGLEELTDGEIHINGILVNDLSPKDRNVAMVFQNYALYPHMTVFDNMAFSLKLAKVEKTQIQERVQRAAETLNLVPFLGRYPRQLSGGQRQRVAMGRAIVRNPQVFLFDEPLSNLDAALRAQMRIEIKALHLQLKTTAVYVTHDQVEAMTIADWLVVMRNGLIEQVGKPIEIYDRPANLFVAGFIGSPAMNFMPGVLDRSGDILLVKLEDGTRVPAPIGATGNHDQPVIYGIRPEHLRLSDSGNGLSLNVILQESTGAETHLVSRLGNAVITAVLRERCCFTPGETITLQVDHEKAHLFDKETEKNLSTD